MDLLAKTTITQPKIILNYEYLPCNFKLMPIGKSFFLQQDYVRLIDIYGSHANTK